MIYDCAALCKEHELKFIERNMNLPQYQIDTIDTEAFWDIARRFAIYYTIHLDENLNPCDLNPLVRNAYVHTALETIKSAIGSCTGTARRQQQHTRLSGAGITF